jgi:hypothetical protein
VGQCQPPFGSGFRFSAFRHGRLVELEELLPFADELQVKSSGLASVAAVVLGHVAAEKAVGAVRRRA